MKKSTYILICLLLGVNFWDLAPILRLLKTEGIFAVNMFWIIAGFYLFHGEKNSSLNTFKYKKIAYGIFLGIFISTFSAYAFWGQSMVTTLIAQRYIYEFLLLLTLLYIEPSEKDIITALKWISIGTIIMWSVSVFAPQFIWSGESLSEGSENEENIRLGAYTPGIHLVAIYLYFLVQDYIKSFSITKFITVLMLVVFFVLYYNRSLLIGVILVLIYSTFKIKSKHKILIISAISIILIAGFIYSSDIWLKMIERTQSDMSDTDYNRWKALDYYLYDYSPNLFCYIFGNGMPSGGHSAFGNLMWSNMSIGIYASDLGMIGMWTYFGLIPLIIIYSIIIKTLVKSHFPLMFKFICFHILIVPTIFEFQAHPGTTFFCLILYFYAYYNEKNKLCSPSLS